MTYTVDLIREAIPFLFMEGCTMPAPEREPGMPGTARDPRTADNAFILMMDIRRAWDHCEWLDDSLRAAMLSMALSDGNAVLAGAWTGFYRESVSAMAERGYELMSLWINSSVNQRERWDWIMEQEDKGYAIPTKLQ